MALIYYTRVMMNYQPNYALLYGKPLNILPHILASSSIPSKMGPIWHATAKVFLVRPLKQISPETLG